MMNKIIVLTLLAVGVMLLAACAPGPNVVEDIPNEENQVAGFWQGLWHGIISPITFVISLFNQDVQIYEVHNNGGWYNFGFLVGASVIFGGSGGGAARKRK
jgi:hypothetical protein